MFSFSFKDVCIASDLKNSHAMVFTDTYHFAYCLVQL